MYNMDIRALKLRYSMQQHIKTYAIAELLTVSYRDGTAVFTRSTSHKLAPTTLQAVLDRIHAEVSNIQTNTQANVASTRKIDERLNIQNGSTICGSLGGDWMTKHNSRRTQAPSLRVLWGQTAGTLQEDLNYPGSLTNAGCGRYTVNFITAKILDRHTRAKSRGVADLENKPWVLQAPNLLQRVRDSSSICTPTIVSIIYPRVEKNCRLNALLVAELKYSRNRLTRHIHWMHRKMMMRTVVVTGVGASSQAQGGRLAWRMTLINASGSSSSPRREKRGMWNG